MNYRNMKCIILVALLLGGCSAIKQKSINEGETGARTTILGVWYHHIGKDDFVMLDLQREYRFNVSVYSCDSGKSFPQEGGSWSLEGDDFQLLWPDRTKKQKLISYSKEKLILLNAPKKGEHYYRVPIFYDSGKACERVSRKEKNS